MNSSFSIGSMSLLPSSVVINQQSSGLSGKPSLCSSSVSGSTAASSIASSQSRSMLTAFSESIAGSSQHATSQASEGRGENETANSGSSPSSYTYESEHSTSSVKLCFKLDEVGKLARFGRNAKLKNTAPIPEGVSKSDIHVIVDIDENAMAANASGKSQKNLEQMIVRGIREDLQTVYTATEENAKLFLCIVVVLLEDGSLARSFWDSEGVAGLVEIAVVFRLFDADTLEVYEGGLIVQREDVGYTPRDLFLSTGRRILFERQVPKIANDVMSRIGDSSYDLLVEF